MVQGADRDGVFDALCHDRPGTIFAALHARLATLPATVLRGEVLPGRAP